MRGLTVKEAAAVSGLHPQTLRRYIREGDLPATKVQGTHGPEWRVSREDVESIRRAQDSDSKQGDSDLRRALSMLTEVTEGIRGIEDFQRALSPSPEELEAERELTEQLVAALEAVPDCAALIAERDQLRRRLEEAEEEVTRLKGRSWWERLFNRD
jgi:excisionase family DNA binding protein